MLIKVFSVSAEHVSKLEQALLLGCVGGGGGGGQQASCLVAKQAVVFPQVLASELLMREDQHGKGL